MPFPLPLVPFEQYMLAEDTPDYPRVFVIDLRLSGRLNRAALERAWRSSLARHPMLRALLVKTRKGWRWTTPPDAPRPIDWGDPGAPLELGGGEMIDLTREPGLRMWVRHDDATARLVLQFHHACCDGIGGLQFVGDLMALYARETGGADAPSELPTLDDGLLQSRGTFGLVRPTFREWLGHVRNTLSESVRLLFRRIRPVDLPRSVDGEPATRLPFAAVETHTLSRDETLALRRAADQAGVTVNDVLLRDLFQTIIRWNRERAQLVPEGWLRIDVPTNLRQRADLRMPAANVMSFTFLDRPASDCQDSTALLKSIHAGVDGIKTGRLGLYFIAQLALLGKVPGAMRLLLGRRRCFASALLTNVGDVGKAFQVAFPLRDEKLVIGNMLLESIAGVPPLRELTRVGVAAISYAGQLTLSAFCDPHAFTREQSRRFLEMYVERIRADVDAARTGDKQGPEPQPARADP